jgi:hypothetical protein
MDEALRIIIARSPEAARDAIDCLRAIGARSPVVNQRYQNTLAVALSDPQATFTADERAILAEAIAPQGKANRSFTFHIRLSQQERAQLAAAADAVGMEMSDYARGVLFA